MSLNFRANPFQKKATKGVTEGSETIIEWPATFSTRTGHVEAVDGQRVAIRRTSDRHLYAWSIPANRRIFVAPGEAIQEHQVIASAVKTCRRPTAHVHWTPAGQPHRYPLNITRNALNALRESNSHGFGVTRAIRI